MTGLVGEKHDKKKIKPPSESTLLRNFQARTQQYIRKLPLVSY